MFKTKNIFSFVILVIIIAAHLSCVDSIIDNKTGTPTIAVYSPASNDTIVVGQNSINYEAADHTNGTGLSHYEIYIDDELSNTVGQNSDGSNPELFLIIPESLINTTISYFVKVYNESGQSGSSEAFHGLVVVDDVPNAPSNLTLVPQNEHSVNLLWTDNSDNETSFEIWRKVSSNGSYGTNPYLVLPADHISTDDDGLSPTIEYFYKVRAVNRTGASEFSNEVSTSGSTTSLWNLKAVAIGSSAVHLTWTDFFQNELGFILERKNPTSGDWERVQPLPLRNTTEYIDYDVSANTTYQYRITYYTNTTMGPWSNKVYITTYYTDDKPPKTLVAFVTGNTTVTVSWIDESTLETGTVIERKKGDNGTFVAVGEVSEDVTAYYETVSVSGRYYYRARHILADKVYTYYSNEYAIDIVIP